MTLGLPPPDRSGAVLIAGSDYGHLPALPGVRANLTDLADFLRSPDGWALPADRCVMVLDPHTPAQILDPIRSLGALCPDTLLVYYAGHGALYDDGELHIALRETAIDRAYTALPYTLIRTEIIRARAARKVAVLDCCYSGNALSTMASDDNPLARQTSIAGSCVITASRAYETASAPADERLTLFTGELVHVLRGGIPGAGAALSLRDVYHQVVASLDGRVRQQPQLQDRNDISGMPFAANHAHDGSGTTGSARPDPVPGEALAPPPRRRAGERPVAARPIDFLGVAYRDPARLLEAMTHNWDEARRWVTEDDERRDLDAWIHTEVRDLDVHVNLLSQRPHDDIEADRRIVWLAAHFAPDMPPMLLGAPADASALASICAAAERAGDSQSPALVTLNRPILEALARHRCRDHDDCGDTAGCRQLAEAARHLDEAWPDSRLRDVLRKYPELDPIHGPDARQRAEHAARMARVHYIHALLDPDHRRTMADQADRGSARTMPDWWCAVVAEADQRDGTAQLAALAVAMATAPMADRQTAFEASVQRTGRWVIVGFILVVGLVLYAIFGPW